jgi:hypothetical protein
MCLPVNPSALFLVLALTTTPHRALATQTAPVDPSAAPSSAASADVDRVKNWQDDIRQLAVELPKRHKNAFFSITREKWDQAAKELAERAPGMADIDIAIGISRMTAMIGDGHTMASLDPKRWPQHPYPVFVRWFSDGVFVIATTPDHRDLLGAKVLRIGSLTIEEVSDRVAALISHDNEATLKHQLPNWIVMAEALRAVGVVDDLAPATFTLLDSQGHQQAIDVAPLERFNRNALIMLPDAKTTKLPISLQPRLRSYWFEHLADSNSLYCRYDRCADDADKPVKQFAQEVLDFIDQHPIGQIIIDLRNNGGGNSVLLRPLIEGLKSRKESGRDHRLYVLIGRRTFSSGMLNANELRRDAGAILVGEPTGGKPNSYGEVKTFALAHSGIEIQYSTKLFFTDDHDPPSLMPDVAVEISSADYFAGRDPVVEAVLAIKPAAEPTRP